MASFRSLRVVATLIACALAGSSPVVGQAPVPTVAQVVIEPVGADGVRGMALLSPMATGGTSVQLLVVGAPTDTFAVIHGGTCDAIDPTPVALLGDVSTTTQLTAATPFQTLADGGHVLALHAGLDLTRAVGCGAIPATSVTPVGTEAPVAGEGFTAPDGSFAIEWPADWVPYATAPVEGESRLGLQKGATSVLLAGRIGRDPDAQACVRNARQELFDRLDAGTLRDLAPLTDGTGATISGVEDDRAWLAYRYVSVEQTGEFDVADYLECRTSGDAVVLILHRSTPDTYAASATERDLLLARLRIPGGTGPAPTAAPGPTVAPGGGSYTAPTVGFTLTWDDRWIEYPAEGLEAYEHIGLSDGPSRVVVSGVIDPAWDALACAQDSDANFQVKVSDGRIRNLVPLTDPDGSRVRGGDAVRAWVGYSYIEAASGGSVAEYHECRAANTVVVRIQHRSLPELYATEAAARDALLAGLTLPSTPPAPPAPTPRPVDPTCAGVPEWIAATQTRFDRVTALRTDADRLLARFDIPGYRAALREFAGEVRHLRASQVGDPVPPLAADANTIAVGALDLFVQAADGLASFHAAGGADAQLYAGSMAALQDAEKALVDLNEAVAALRETCP